MTKLPDKIEHVKRVRSKGKDYRYFNTGQRDENGRPIRVSLPDADSGNFWDVYASLKGHRERRKKLVTRYTFGKLIDEYYDSAAFQRLTKGSQYRYGLYLNATLEHVGEAPADDLRAADLRAMFSNMDLSPAIENLTRGAIASVYKFARRNDRVPQGYNPTTDLEPRKTGEHEPWAQSILESALKSKNDRLRLAAHLLYYTGQRIGDVVKMRWNSIQGDKMAVVQQKTGRDMRIAIHPDLLAELSRHERKGMTILCHSITGAPITDQVIRQAIKMHGDAFGEKIVPHGLRKNAVNALLEAGCTRDEVRSITGQSDSTIEHYAKRRDLSVISENAVIKWGQNKK